MRKELHFGEKVEIKTENIDENTIKEMLKEFHIEKIEMGTGDAEKEITIRTLSKEIKNIEVGEERYEIHTLSNLKEGEREIYPKLESVSGEWMFPLGIAILILSILLFFWKVKKKKIPTPMEEFEIEMENISPEKWPFQISYALRKLIDGTLDTKFLQGIYAVKSIITSEEIELLKEMDFIKYSGKFSEKEREIWIEKVRDIARKIKGVENDKI
ncbi:MAG: hypothetical protein ACRCTS_00750 [Fusobacteriaceae bacterium]